MGFDDRADALGRAYRAQTSSADGPVPLSQAQTDAEPRNPLEQRMTAHPWREATQEHVRSSRRQADPGAGQGDLADIVQEARLTDMRQANRQQSLSQYSHTNAADHGDEDRETVARRPIGKMRGSMARCGTG